MSIAVADLRRSPAHAAELSSQLLLGEVVRILGGPSAGGWLRVETLEDRYRGWLKTWAIVPVDAPTAMKWQRTARHRIARPIAEITAPGGARERWMPVFLGSRLRRVQVRRGIATIRLPDGRSGAVPAAAVATAGTPPVDLADRLRTLAGVPYLWGGRTPAGFDCSGLVQVTLAEQGIALPRDARDQLSTSRRLPASEAVRRGDLVFFGRPREPVSHVGIMLDRSTYVHCRGWVRTASLDPESALCDMDLLPQIRCFARPSRGPSQARKPRSRRLESA